MKRMTTTEINQPLAGKLRLEDINLATSIVTTMADSQRFIADICRKAGCAGCNGKIEGCPTLPYGNKHSKLMVITDRPSEIDVYAKASLFDSAGRLFSLIASKAGLDRESIYTTSCAKCYTTHQNYLSEMYYCSGNFLEREVRLIKPKIILTLGNDTAQVVRGVFLNQADDINDISQLRGHFYKGVEAGYEDIEIYHTFSPAVLISQVGSIYDSYKKLFWQDICAITNKLKTI